METTQDSAEAGVNDLAYNNRWRAMASMYSEVSNGTQIMMTIPPLTLSKIDSLARKDDDESHEEAQRMAMEALTVPDLPLVMRVQAHIVLASFAEVAPVWHGEKAVELMETSMKDAASYGQSEEDMLTAARQALSSARKYQEENPPSSDDNEESYEDVDEGEEEDEDGNEDEDEDDSNENFAVVNARE